jgi:hypothetical protein
MWTDGRHATYTYAVSVHVRICSCRHTHAISISMASLCVCSWTCTCRCCCFCSSDVYEHMTHVCDSFSTSVPFEEQMKSANSHGYKWSELLRLPYFEPSRFITVDPMHCLFLGKSHAQSHHAHVLSCPVFSCHVMSHHLMSCDQVPCIHVRPCIIVHAGLGHAKDFWFRILDYFPTTSQVRIY